LYTPSSTTSEEKNNLYIDHFISINIEADDRMRHNYFIDYMSASIVLSNMININDLKSSVFIISSYSVIFMINRWSSSKDSIISNIINNW